MFASGRFRLHEHTRARFAVKTEKCGSVNAGMRLTGESMLHTRSWAGLLGVRGRQETRVRNGLGTDGVVRDTATSCKENFTRYAGVWRVEQQSD